MSVVDFEYNLITTITMVFRMKGEIDLHTLFPLLPITKLDLPVKSGRSSNVKNFKIPVLAPAGSIVSARVEDQVLGIVRSTSKKAFKNSITLDMAIKTKYINMKVSRQTIQMTGPKSIDNGKEAVVYLIKHIYHINSMLRQMYTNPIERDAAIEWVLANTKSSDTYMMYEDGDWDIDYGVEMPTCPIPDNINKIFADFLLSHITKYDSYLTYTLFLNLIKNKKSCIITQPYDIGKVEIGTININYSLNFMIDRHKLVNLINGRNGFLARFVNSIETKASIELPCPELGPRGSKNKQPSHSILVYRSGKVTQSGPRPDLMKKAYYKFNNLVKKLRPFIEIESENPAMKLRYIPIYDNKLPEPTSDLLLEGPIVINNEDIWEDILTEDPEALMELPDEEEEDDGEESLAIVESGMGPISLIITSPLNEIPIAIGICDRELTVAEHGSLSVVDCGNVAFGL